MFEEVLVEAQSLLDAANFADGEESAPQSVWSARVECYMRLCHKVEIWLQEGADICPPPTQLLIILGGILGNGITSAKLYTSEDLKEVVSHSLKSLQLHCGVRSIRELLLLQPRISSHPPAETLAIQFLRLCIARVARLPTDRRLTTPWDTCPLYRDALVWLTDQLDYPEISEEEFIGAFQPLGLQLTSDYRESLQLAGFQLLQQLAHKARVADWRQNNRAEAVLFQLFEHRITSNPNSSEQVVCSAYKTMFDMVRLLPEKVRAGWNIKLTDRLLLDLIMETRKNKQATLLHLLLKQMQYLQLGFIAHSRQFFRAYSIIMLGPRTPDCLMNSVASVEQDVTVYLLMLQCVQLFLRLAWPLAGAMFLPDLIPPLVAFVDLEFERAKQSSPVGTPPSHILPIFEQIKAILSMLSTIQPKLLGLLESVCEYSPSFAKLVPLP
ncbi:unnamed protein product [Dicrocoelium dendriticum]|nr:unnamed protein product [Dicrocoelium dendriticum]